MKQFINEKETVVTEAIEGVIAASNGKLTRLDGFPHIKVVLRSEIDRAKVALVSGGGSGHEPAHAGFVGQGMLSAAVCGDVFASPSLEAILAGILAVTGPAGCLLIVKNYTGDRLNFGLAAERARALGLRVNMVIVDDDVALPDLPQQRGLAGTLLVHKIAGAMAEAGEDLDTITEAAKQIIKKTVTIGMSLDTCTLPGAAKEARIGDGQAELGLGIHGEPGVEQIDFVSAKQAMAKVVDKLANAIDSQPLVALINNLGGATALEMAILTRELMHAKIGGQIQYVIGPAAMMTSLDMRGFSVTLFPANDAEIAWLRAAFSPNAWPGCAKIEKGFLLPLPDGLKPVAPKASAHAMHRGFLTKCCEILIAEEDRLNNLDAKSGDGDTGTTLATAARALIAVVDDLPLADISQLYRAIGAELSQTMGGSSGILMAIFFSAAGDASSSGLGIIDALKRGLARVEEVGGARPGDRTFIDALGPALEGLATDMAVAAQAARKGADFTASLGKARAGRATYVPSEKLVGHNDPGAEAVARLFEGLRE